MLRSDTWQPRLAHLSRRNVATAASRRFGSAALRMGWDGRRPWQFADQFASLLCDRIGRAAAMASKRAADDEANVVASQPMDTDEKDTSAPRVGSVVVTQKKPRLVTQDVERNRRLFGVLLKGTLDTFSGAAPTEAVRLFCFFGLTLFLLAKRSV